MTQSPPATAGEGLWTPTELKAPPQDQSLFWAWLHDMGIREMQWLPDDTYEPDGGAYVLVGDNDDEYEPEFWAPYDAIPNPGEQWAHCREDSPTGVDQ